VEDVGTRRLMVKPEVVVLVVALLVAFSLMWRTSSGSCHHWKMELGHISGAFLASAGAEEYPEAGGLRGRTPEEAESLRRATKKVLDARPFGCF
jgi:hypothetical protein